MERVIERRRWYSGPTVIVRTAWRTVQALRNHKLGALVPLFGYLLVGAVVLWMINAVAPLAPFVYSLF